VVSSGALALANKIFHEVQNGIVQDAQDVQDAKDKKKRENLKVVMYVDEWGYVSCRTTSTLNLRAWEFVGFIQTILHLPHRWSCHQLGDDPWAPNALAILALPTLGPELHSHRAISNGTLLALR